MVHIYWWKEYTKTPSSRMYIPVWKKYWERNLRREKGARFWRNLTEREPTRLPRKTERDRALLKKYDLVEEVWGIDKRMRPWSHGNIVLFRRQFKESRWGVMKPCTMEVKRTKEKDINRWKIGTPREGARGEWCEMPIPGSLQREEA